MTDTDARDAAAPATPPTPPAPPERRTYRMSKRAVAAEETRQRIAQAVLDLFAERDYDQITLAEIARAAGVSHQTVLNHFESKAGVVPYAVQLFSAQVRALQLDAVPGDITSVVQTTCARYEVLGDLNAKWAAMESRLPDLVLPSAARARQGFQLWLVEMLGEHLPPAEDAAEHRRVLLGLHAALDVFTWKLFRRDIGLSREQTEQQMTDLVLGVLARHRDSR